MQKNMCYDREKGCCERVNSNKERKNRAKKRLSGTKFWFKIENGYSEGFFAVTGNGGNYA